jgi:hypothetical protein
MTTKVKIKSGEYANKPVVNEIFNLVKPVSKGRKGYFVTVDGSELTGQVGRNIRVLVKSPEHVVEVNAKPVESDEQAIERIRKRFEILDTMTDAIANQNARGLIVSGPPGVGKSFGVEKILDEYEAMHRLQGHKGSRTEVVKGSMTPIGLYQTLFMNSGAGDILDSGKKRTISWKSESAALRREGIPDRFDFKGGVIFITNVNFENVRSKKIQDHLEALMSRCHYIDLEMDSERDRFLRIEQIVRDGMLSSYGFGDKGEREIIEFMKTNAKRLREISLRMVLKISDLRKMSEDTWQDLAKSTCMKRI